MNLQERIAEQGCLAPIFVGTDGQILDGHHRAEALEALGVPIQEWPIIIWPENELVGQRQAVAKYFREMYARLCPEGAGDVEP